MRRCPDCPYKSAPSSGGSNPGKSHEAEGKLFGKESEAALLGCQTSSELPAGKTGLCHPCVALHAATQQPQHSSRAAGGCCQPRGAEAALIDPRQQFQWQKHPLY